MSSTLITDVRIFDGTSVIPNGHVLISAHHIQEIGPGPYPHPFTGTTLSFPNHTVVPGLIDAHIHVNAADPRALPQCLRFGVTTACDLSNSPAYIRTLLAQIRAQGDGICADLKTAQCAATIEGGWPEPVVLAVTGGSAEARKEVASWPKLVTAEDGREYVRRMRLEEGGLDYVKVMHESGRGMGLELPKPSGELQRAIVEEAHGWGLRVLAHATGLEDTLEILEMGVDGLAHAFFDQAADERVIKAYRRAGAHCNPTLATVGSSTGEGMEMQRGYARDERVRARLDEEILEGLQKCLSMSKTVEGATVEHAYETVRELHAAGVDIVCGSDAHGPCHGVTWGLTMHHELALLVDKCGMTPIEALRSATSTVARRFNFADRGEIKPGKRADLLLVEGDPTTNIDDTLNIRGVWKNGVAATKLTLSS